MVMIWRRGVFFRTRRTTTAGKRKTMDNFGNVSDDDRTGEPAA
jgi:hypothetical protein